MTELGWYYVSADEAAQKYKEGMTDTHRPSSSIASIGPGDDGAEETQVITC